MNEYGATVPDLGGVLSSSTVVRQERQHQLRQNEFVKGPIPLNWLAKATRKGKLAIAAALLLWFRAGCLKPGSRLTVSRSQFERFGLSNDTFNRGLKMLESAGLVKIDRKPGRKLAATLIVVETAVDCASAETSE